MRPSAKPPTTTLLAVSPVACPHHRWPLFYAITRFARSLLSLYIVGHLCSLPHCDSAGLDEISVDDDVALDCSRLDCRCNVQPCISKNQRPQHRICAFIFHCAFVFMRAWSTITTAIVSTARSICICSRIICDRTCLRMRVCVFTRVHHDQSHVPCVRMCFHFIYINTIEKISRLSMEYAP